MPASQTEEGRLIRTVPFVDVSAARTPLRGVGWIDQFDRNTGDRGFVADEIPELPECPSVQSVPLLLALGLGSIADMRQVFQRKAATGAFSFGNECLRNYVVFVFPEAALATGQALKFAPLVTADRALCSGCRAALMVSAQGGVAVTGSVDGIPAEGRAVARSGNVRNSEVYADPVFRAEFIGLGNLACADQKPLATDKGQVSLTLSESEGFVLPLASHERDFDASGQRPDRKGVALNRENALVIGLRREAPENGNYLAVDLEGVGNLGNATNGSLRCKSKVRAHRSISQFVQVELARLAVLKSMLRKPVAGGVAALKRLFQRLCLFLGRLELYCRNELHAFIYRRIGGYVKLKKGREFLPGLNAGVSFAQN